MNPRISILMPVWNGEKYLAAALDSVFAQTFTDFELIVVDDGSTDRTPEILRACPDPRLRVLRLEHAGIVLALNHGLAHARADWIARQDADDLSGPERLERQWQAVRQNPRAVLCHTAAEHFGAGDVALPDPARLPQSRSFMALKLCYQCPVVHTSVLFRKAAAQAAGGYLPAERHAEDFALWGRLLAQGDFVALPQKLVRFRLHAQSVSRQNLEKQLALVREIGIRHCREFMRLGEADAARANALLLAGPAGRSRRDWLWFLCKCAPRLRWWSLETLGWLFWQTVKTAVQSRPKTVPGHA